MVLMEIGLCAVFPLGHDGSGFRNLLARVQIQATHFPPGHGSSKPQRPRPVSLVIVTPNSDGGAEYETGMY